MTQDEGVDVQEPGRLVVVGASLAGTRAVEAARRAGFAGRITLVGAEPHLPYDRPPLSKAFLEAEQEPPPPTLRDAASFADELRVELRLGQRATGLDVVAQRLLLGEGDIRYDRLIIATGANARSLPLFDGIDGVHVLRGLEDAVAIRRGLANARRVVVIGAGFIGSEVASSARHRGCQVTIVEAAEMPLIRALGTRMGVIGSALHERHGTGVRCGVTVTGVDGGDRVRSVRLSDGTTLPADLVVVGVGAAPATGWLADSGLAIEDGVLCDETLATAAPGVYAAGDVARWRDPLTGELTRAEHWTSAAEQGEAAGRNAVAAEPRPYRAVPYIWSDWYGSRIQLLGACSDEVRVVSGDVENLRFVALYRSRDELGGVLAVDAQTEVMKYRRLLRNRSSWADALAFAESRTAVAVRT